jgi:hypothetical protein
MQHFFLTLLSIEASSKGRPQGCCINLGGTSSAASRGEGRQADWKRPPPADSGGSADLLLLYQRAAMRGGLWVRPRVSKMPRPSPSHQLHWRRVGRHNVRLTGGGPCRWQRSSNVRPSSQALQCVHRHEASCCCPCLPTAATYASAAAVCKSLCNARSMHAAAITCTSLWACLRATCHCKTCSTCLCAACISSCLSAALSTTTLSYSESP